MFPEQEQQLTKKKLLDRDDRGENVGESKSKKWVEEEVEEEGGFEFMAWSPFSTELVLGGLGWVKNGGGGGEDHVRRSERDKGN